jgi:hypothetical protein
MNYQQNSFLILELSFNQNTDFVLIIIINVKTH